MQTAAVAIIVLACAAYLARGAWRTVAGKRGGVGNCCPTGCGAAGSEPRGEAFVPADALRRGPRRVTDASTSA